MSKSKISAAREGYTPRTNTVTICLDTGISSERDALMAQLAEASKPKAKANERLAQKSPATKLREEIEALEKREREHMHTLRFAKLSPLEWADVTALYSPRDGSHFDASLGYNHHAAAVHAAKINGVEIVDGEVVKLDDEDWAAILEVASGWDIENIVTVVLDLNVLHASRSLGRLKKD
jgi:hypothetical protein